MLITGTQGETRKLNAIFATAVSRAELDCIQPVLDRGLSQPPRFMYIGRLSPEGVPHLIEAVSMFYGGSALPRARAGDPHKRRRLEELTQLDAGLLLYRTVGRMVRPCRSHRFLLPLARRRFG